MSGSPALAVQGAVMTRLSGDAALSTLLGGAKVYDNVPTGTTYPYVVIGDDTQAPNDTMGTTGRDLTLTIHGWSRYVGRKQVKEIMDRVDQLLDRWTPTLTGWGAVQMLNDYGPESFLDPDGITRHGVSRYRVHTYQT